MNRSLFVTAGLVAVVVPRRADAESLEDHIARLARSSSGTVGVFARKLTHGSQFGWNADDVFPTASISKILIMLAVFRRAEKYGRELFERRIELKLSDFVGGSEILDGYNPGNTITIDRLVRAMIEQSDNTASNVLIDYVGFAGVREAIAAAGLRHTQLKRHYMDVNAIMHHSENLTTARDMGSLLFQIERGAHEAIRTVASPASCRAMIDIMLRQEDRDKIARGLPRGTPLANKTGEIDGVRNDVGIVDPYGENPYVIAVLTKDLDDFSLGNIAIRKIASAINGAFT